MLLLVLIDDDVLDLSCGGNPSMELPIPMLNIC